MSNIILNTDSYKISHWKMMPNKTEEIYSYCEARKGGDFKNVLFFGLQYTMIKHLEGPVVTQENLNEARLIVNPHFGSEEFLYLEGWQTIIDEYGGCLPLEIKAVPEGTLVPEGNVLFTIRNTDLRFYWLTNYVETLLMRTWYPITVATKSFTILKNIKKYMERSSDNPEMYKFMLHDFGSRGTSCEEQAAIGGASHIVNGLGTDTLSGIKLLVDYYSAGLGSTAFSVAATEHSVACSFGENEFDYVRHQLEAFPKGILSIVGDTFNIEKFVKEVIASLKTDILERYDKGVQDMDIVDPKVVIRPDSPRFEGDTPANQVLYLVEELSKIFGYDTNNKGYKVLDPSIGLIYGDSLTDEEIDTIYNLLLANGWSAENCVVGQGGGLLQKVNRDTCRFAIKASSVTINGGVTPISKSPLDDSKSSKRGKLKLIKTDNGFETISYLDSRFWSETDVMQTVFENGKITREYTLDEIRANTEKWM